MISYSLTRHLEIPEVDIYERKILRKKESKHAFDQEATLSYTYVEASYLSGGIRY